MRSWINKFAATFGAVTGDVGDRNGTCGEPERIYYGITSILNILGPIPIYIFIIPNQTDAFTVIMWLSAVGYVQIIWIIIFVMWILSYPKSRGITRVYEFVDTLSFLNIISAYTMYWLLAGGVFAVSWILPAIDNTKYKYWLNSSGVETKDTWTGPFAACMYLVWVLASFIVQVAFQPCMDNWKALVELLKDDYDNLQVLKDKEEEALEENRSTVQVFDESGGITEQLPNDDEDASAWGRADEPWEESGGW